MNAAKTGNLGSKGDVHLHVTTHYHMHAIVSDGVAGMLEKHNDTFARHLQNQLRKMNR